MTEQEWRRCRSVRDLLQFVDPQAQERRKRLLFNVACCRFVLPLSDNETSRSCLKAIEEYADRRIKRRQMHVVVQKLREVSETLWPDSVESYAAEAIRSACLPRLDSPAMAAATLARANQIASQDRPPKSLRIPRARQPEVEQMQTDILRDLFNPFRPVTIDPRWQTSTVTDLARTIYEEFQHIAPGLPGVTDGNTASGNSARDPRQAGGYMKMHILADALMDAGCDSEDILNHCRSDGPHVLGCWVVDLLSGRE